MAKNKSWKDALLSSGLPLEHDVREILKSLGVIHPTEYKYQRRNELGFPTFFSIDVHGTLYGEGIHIELLVECKYRHDSARWIFTPESYDGWIYEFSDLFITLDKLAGGGPLNRKKLDRFADRYDLCAKSVELLQNDANPKGIKEGLSQLRFAVGSVIASCMRSQLFRHFGNSNPIHIILPIIVTTAEIWRIKPGLSMLDIRSAGDLAEVAERKDLVILNEEPDLELMNYTSELLRGAFSADERDALEMRLEDTTFDDLVSIISTNYPSMFLVVDYSRFKPSMERMISFFSNVKLLNAQVAAGKEIKTLGD